MVHVIVVHSWEDSQKDKVMDFAKQVTDMAKNKKLPKELKLLSIDLAENKNMAVCNWDVDSVDHLMQVAGQLKPSWKIDAFTAKSVYKKGIL